MNIKLIFFNGIMTALVGAMLGISVAYIGQRAERAKIITFGGATLGFVIGTMESCIRQQKEQKDSEYEQ